MTEEEKKLGNLTNVELRLLEQAQDEQNWDLICDEIKAGRANEYPGDWYQKVILSGLATRVSARWGGDAEIHVSAA